MKGNGPPMTTTIEFHRDELRALMIYLDIAGIDISAEDIGLGPSGVRDFSNAYDRLDQADRGLNPR